MAPELSLQELLEAYETEGWPEDFQKEYTVMECLTERDGVCTFRVLNHSGESFIAKCRTRASQKSENGSELLADLSCEGLPKWIGRYENAETAVTVREYIDGMPLDRYAEEYGLTPEESIRICGQLCDILSYLHNRKEPVIHRDIKPQNVIVRADGSVALIDFDIARVFRSGSETDTTFFGTRAFAPPEQYGFTQTDARSDLYSLGVLLRWMLTGSTREAANTGLSPALAAVTEKCTAFSPEDRYASAQQLKQAIQNAEKGVDRRSEAPDRKAGRNPRPGGSESGLSEPETSNDRERKPVVSKNRICVRMAFAMVLVVLACVGTVSYRRQEAASRAVSFSSPLIEQAVRLNLGLGENEAIRPDMLEQVTAVFAVADRAYPDSDSFYSAIGQWYAGGRSGRGTITSLSDLSNMPNLERVCIVAQELSDISAMEKLSGLNHVELKHNDVADISALAGKDRLAYVGINDNPVRDISPLTECRRLAYLDLCDVRSYDPTVIAGLGNFNFLDISNPTESYRFLNGKSILDLRIAWTSLDDLSCLDGVSRLERLEIDHTKVADLSPLARHIDLKVLKLAGLPVSDFRVLLQLPQLEEVHVSPEMRTEIEKLGEVPFAVVID